jgi:hypothetical protein
MKNRILIICFLLGWLNIISAQNNQQCYIREIDISGFNTDKYQNLLNITACNLVQSFPTEFRDSFKVFDFGFYLHNETMKGNFPPIFNDMVNDVKKKSPYYLVFGKQSDNTGIYSKFWINLHLPNEGDFSCMDKISSNLRIDLQSKLNILANDVHVSNNKRTYEYCLAEKAVMDTLKSFIIKTVDCCDPLGPKGQRSVSSCSGCVLSSEEIIKRQKSLNFIFDPAIIIKDEDFSARTGKSGVDRSSSKINAEIRLSLDTKYDPISVDELVRLYTDNQKEWIKAGSMSIHYFKYPRDCAEFESKWSTYLNDPADVSFFVSLVNVNNNFGVLGFNYRESETFKQGNRNGCSNCVREDEKEEVTEIRKEVTENGKIACGEVVNLSLEWMAKSYSYYYKYARDYARPVTIEETNAYKAMIAPVDAKLSDARQEFNIYYQKEYAYVKLEYDQLWNNSTWKVDYALSMPKSWKVSQNLCSEHIHSILDYCGLVEGLGAGCDLINAGVYLVEGAGGDAALAGLSVIPFLSEAIPTAKYGSKIWSATGSIADCFTGGKGSMGGAKCKLCKVVRKGFNLDWGRSERLRELFIAKLTTISSNMEAHHIFPFELASSKLESAGQRLLEKLNKRGWHVNDPDINGVLLKGLTNCGKKYHTKNSQYYDDIFIELVNQVSAIKGTKRQYEAMMKTTNEIKRILLEGEKIAETASASNFKNLNAHIKEAIPNIKTFIENTIK